MCGKEHIGKTFRDGKLEFYVSEGFYKGRQIDEQELARLVKEFDSINLVGDEAISVAVKEGIVDEKGVKSIAGVKHAIVFRV